MTDPLEGVAAALADRYQIDLTPEGRPHLIGQGGMAAVYLAQDLRHHRPVAIKIIRPGLSALLGPDRFLREIAIAARLNHPHILPLHDSGEAAGQLYYVMPYEQGGTLRDRLEREGPLAIEEAVRIVGEVASALEYAHGQGVVHRDIKPSNILLSGGYALVADFGLARAIDPASDGLRLSGSGLALGTLPYMSPEQSSGSDEVDGRSDLFSLGCVLYELLAGRAPQLDRTFAPASGARRAPSLRTFRPDIPIRLEETVNRALEWEPAARFQSAREFAEALAGPGPASTRRVAQWWDGLKTRRGRWIGVGTLSVAGLLGWGWWATTRNAVPVSTDWVVITDFIGPAADPQVTSSVQDLVAYSLDQSGRFARVPPYQVFHARRLNGIADTMRLTVDNARKLSHRTIVRLILDGGVSRLPGDRYAIALRAIGAEDGGVLAAGSTNATTADIIPKVEELTRSVLAKVSGGLPARPPPRTSSFEAFRQFRAANDANNRGDHEEAVRLAREAVRIDPDFATAWLLLSVYYFNADKRDSSKWALAQAELRKDRLSPRQLRDLAISKAPTWADRIRAAELAVEVDPRAEGYNELGMCLLETGRYEAAAANFERAIKLSPFAPVELFMSNQYDALVALSELSRAREVAGRLSDNPVKQGILLSLDIASRAWADLERRAHAVLSDPAQSNTRRLWGTISLASAHAVRGRVAIADQWLEHGLEVRAETFDQEHDVRLPRLLQNFVTKRPIGACAPPDPADTNAGGWIMAGIQCALSGDTIRGRKYRDQVWARPLDPDIAGVDALVLDATLAWAAGNWRAVIDTVGSLAGEGSGDIWGSVLLRRLLVAGAYERLELPDSAAVYYEMVVTPFRLVYWQAFPSGLVYSFAQHRLAGLYTSLRAYDRARQHYTTFLETFTDPDPPYRWMVNQAREELQKRIRD